MTRRARRSSRPSISVRTATPTICVSTQRRSGSMSVTVPARAGRSPSSILRPWSASRNTRSAPTRNPFSWRHAAHEYSSIFPGRSRSASLTGRRVLSRNGKFRGTAMFTPWPLMRPINACSPQRCSPDALRSWTRARGTSSPRSLASSASTTSGSMRSASAFAPPVQGPSMCSSRATPTTIAQSHMSLSGRARAVPASTSRAEARRALHVLAEHAAARRLGGAAVLCG